MGTVNRVVEDVVVEHALRCIALWDERERMVRSRVHDLTSLDDLDYDLRAHLAALALAGVAGWELAMHTWAWSVPAAAFAGLVVAAKLGDRGRIEDVVASCDRPELFPGLVSALGWLPLEVARPLLDDWADYDGPRWRALALAGYAAHRHDPGRVVDKGLIHRDVDVRQQAARAAGFLNRRELALVLASMLSDHASATRFLVARALRQLRVPEAAETLWSCAVHSGPRGELAAELAVRQVPPSVALEWIERLATYPGTGRQVVAAAAASGLPDAMRWLLPAMDLPETARLAGHGFATLTGIDLEDAGLVDDSEPLEDSLDVGEAGLPRPDRAKIEAWWSRREPGFGRAQRWRQGRPQCVRVIREALLTGPQNERTLAAHDLLLMHRSHAVPFETHAPAWRQRRWLAPLRVLFRGQR